MSSCFVSLLWFFDMTLTSWSSPDPILVSKLSSLNEVSVQVGAIWTPRPVRSETFGTTRSSQTSSEVWPGETNCHLSAVAHPKDPWAISGVAAFIMAMPQELFELSWQENATEPTERRNCLVKKHTWNNNEKKLSRNKVMRLMTTAGMIFCLFIYFISSPISFHHVLAILPGLHTRTNKVLYILWLHIKVGEEIQIISLKVQSQTRNRK